MLLEKKLFIGYNQYVEYKVSDGETVTKVLPLPIPGPRMRALIDMMPVCEVGAEIGADHGITAAHLVSGGICGRMIVTDISAASLDKARRRFAMHGLTDRADFRVADGLAALDAPVGAILIAGMGADTITHILSRGMDRIGDAALVLGPNPNPHIARRWLMENGFAIEAEAIAREDRRYYIVLRARRGEARYTEKELLLGPVLLRERPPLLHDYLTWRHGCTQCMQDDTARRALTWIEEALHP